MGGPKESEPMECGQAVVGTAWHVLRMCSVEFNKMFEKRIRMFSRCSLDFPGKRMKVSRGKEPTTIYKSRVNYTNARLATRAADGPQECFRHLHIMSDVDPVRNRT